MGYSSEEMEQKFDKEFVIRYAGQREKEQITVRKPLKVEVPNATELAKVREHD